MELFLNGTSPYARVVRIVALEKNLGHALDLSWVDPWNDDAALVDVNPHARVPVLLTDEGVALTESLLICLYLDGLDGTRSLLPQAQRAEVLALAGIGQGLIDAAFNTVIARKHQGIEAERSLLGERRWRSIERSLKLLDEELGVPLTEPLLGDIIVAVALSYLDFRLPDYAWQQAHPRLAAWDVAMQARPHFVATRFA
jgi:glutathione S-transferase